MTNVLIVPGGAGSIGVAEALKDRYNVVAGDLNPCAPALLRKEVTGYELPPVDDEDKYIEKLSEIIAEEEIDVLIPSYDLDVTTVSKRRNDLPEDVEYLLPAHEKIQLSDDTLRSVKLAMEAGVPCPDTYATVDEAVSADSNDFPLFIKPRESMGGRGAMKVENIEELEWHFERIYREWGSPVIQEYIPSSTGSMYMVGLLYDTEGNINSTFTSRSIRTYYSWGGGGVSAEPVENEQIIDYAKSIVDEIEGWRGPINMEFLSDPRDDTYKFVEINPRLWGYNYIATINGMNLPSKIVRMCLGETVEPQYTHSSDNVLLFDFDEIVHTG